MSQILPTGADHAWAQDKSSRAATIGERFLEKIQNSGRRFTLD